MIVRPVLLLLIVIEQHLIWALSPMSAPALTLEGGNVFKRHWTVVVPVSIDVAYDTWVEYVWIRGAGLPIPSPIIVSQGGSDGLGLERMMAPPFLRERIVETSKPFGLRYKVMNPGYFTYQVKDHEGAVRFSAQGESSTMVTWEVRGDPLAGCSWMVLRMTELVISSCIENFKRHCSKI